LDADPNIAPSLHLARLVERVSKNFGERRLTGVVFLDVAKAFDTVWIDGLLFKLTALMLPSYLVKTISSLPLPLQQDVRGVPPNGHIQTSWHAAWRSTRGTNLSCFVQSVCQ
jgi:hypothetical protein